ncbi:hypothetical protein H072_9430 [Dactylellina haptotyla CBS 200.50]|uniref:Uncharacterized protein n=1 Tax=Dactylellina haptotyla (strain CBS 200.50) TaxID=1284197 RepID=S8A2M3_DACHA|nr:hypothetical protein H072_9430 [Dactylellina haptotyla CBS 200.50]
MDAFKIANNYDHGSRDINIENIEPVDLAAYCKDVNFVENVLIEKPRVAANRTYASTIVILTCIAGITEQNKLLECLVGAIWSADGTRTGILFEASTTMAQYGKLLMLKRWISLISPLNILYMKFPLFNPPPKQITEKEEHVRVWHDMMLHISWRCGLTKDGDIYNSVQSPLPGRHLLNDLIYLGIREWGDWRCPCYGCMWSWNVSTG